MLFSIFFLPIFVALTLAGYPVSDDKPTPTFDSKPSNLPEPEKCVVSVPAYITEEVSPPSWIDSWDSISFSAEDCSAHVLELPEDTTVEYSAKMYVYSFTKDHNVTDWIDFVEQRPNAYQLLDQYWETGECGEKHEDSKEVPEVDPNDSAGSSVGPVLGVSLLALAVKVLLV